MEGWIKLHRKIVDNPYYFSEPFTRSQAWIDLIIIANHKDNFFYNRGIKVEVKIGQIGSCLETLSKRWKWSRGKVERFIIELENSNQVVRQKNNVNTLLILINYKIYQQDSKANSKADGQQTVKQTDTNKNEKNVKEEEYADFILLLNKITGRNFKGDEKSKKQFNARKSEGFDLRKFGIAINNCFNDEFHKLNRKFLTPEFITRSDKLQKYFIEPKDEIIIRKDTFEVGETDKLMML